MFKNNKKQYINILKEEKELKLSYKILEDDEVVKSENSSFIVTKNKLPKDGISKLNILQSDLPNTYLTTTLTTPKQFIEQTANLDNIAYDSVELNEKYSIAIARNDLKLAKGEYEKTGLDYIVSPYTILYNVASTKLSKNSLSVYIYDNKLYILVFDKDKEIALCEVKTLTALDEVKDSSFSEDENMEQQIYNEVYFLEIQQTLSDLVQKYYQENKDIEFLEEVNIYYSVNQINDEQLDSLHETLMAKVNYFFLDINEEIFELELENDIKEYSFIEPREKVQSKEPYYWIAGGVVVLLAALYFIFFATTQEEEVKKETPVKKEMKQKQEEPKKPKVVKKESIKFPNHTSENTKIVNQLVVLFDLVPYDAILKEVELRKDGSTFVCNFIANSQSSQEMKTQLQKLYKDSKIILKHENKAVMSTIIENKGKIEQEEPVKYSEYKPHEFMSIATTTKYLESVVSKGSVVKLSSKSSDKFTVYKFNISSNIKHPNEFFDFVQELNKKALPFNITYPVEFAKVNNGLVVKYEVEFKQHNKPQPKLAK